jgi:iron complex outermembrane recepter protein
VEILCAFYLRIIPLSLPHFHSVELRNLMSTQLFFPIQLSTIFIAATLSFAAIADDEKIETVIVSATRSETANVPVATQIKVISAEDIRVSGAKVITDVLRSQAGIQISDGDGSGLRNVTASMHGLSGTNNVLILVDGRKLNNPSTAAPALNTVALGDVERIEIVQGSAGVLYGDQAVGGVINIITRRAVAGEIHGSANATAGTGNLEDYAASITQGFTNGLSYNLSAQKRNADNYRDNNQSANENVLANVRYDFTQGFVFVEGQRVDDKLRLAGSISDEQAEINPRSTDSPNDYSNQLTKLWRLGGGVDISKQWKFLAEYSDRDEKGEYFSYGLTPSSMQVKSFTPRVVGTFGVSQGDAIVTLGYDQVESDYISKSSWGINYNRDANQEINGIYGQVIYPITQMFSMTAGIRDSEVKNNNHHVTILNATLPAEKRKPNAYKDDNFASEFGMSYKLDNGWRAFARIADGFRYANPDDNGLVLPSVAFLDTQKSRTAEGGFEWLSEALSLQISYFNMNIENEIFYDALIANADSSFGGRGANINLDESERKGIIFDGTSALNEYLTLSANYSYTDAVYLAGTFKNKTVPSVAKHNGNVNILFHFPSAITANLIANYRGKYYRSGDEANIEALVNSVVTFDANLGWAYKSVDLSARVKNMTNERYAGLNLSYGGGYYVQYPQPERAYEVSVAYRF